MTQKGGVAKDCEKEDDGENKEAEWKGEVVVRTLTIGTESINGVATQYPLLFTGEWHIAVQSSFIHTQPVVIVNNKGEIERGYKMAEIFLWVFLFYYIFYILLVYRVRYRFPTKSCRTRLSNSL